MDTNLLAALVKAAADAAKPLEGQTSVGMKVFLALLTALPPLLVAIMVFLKARKVEADVKEVHLSINSRLDEWLKIERTQGEATGREQAKVMVVDTAIVPVAPAAMPALLSDVQMQQTVDWMQAELQKRRQKS